MDIFLFAVVALLLAYRLYTVLGRDEGPIPERATNAPIKPKVEKIDPADKLEKLLRRNNIPLFLKPTFAAILLRDPSFDFKDFSEGAESAYDMILTHAFHHELDAVLAYVSPNVEEGFKTFQKVERVRIKVTDLAIVGAEFQNPTAKITVQFKSELQEKTSSWTRMEDWVFVRDLDSENPAWILEEILPLQVH